MPSHRRFILIAALCGVGGAYWGTAASAFQYPPLSDDINTRHIHAPDAWVGGGFQSSGPINHSPAEFGPAIGMRQRSRSGDPASGDSFPTMTAGPLPGGLSRDGFNGSGMWPPVNMPRSIANNPLFGGGGQSQYGQNPAGQMPFGQNSAGQNIAPSSDPNGAANRSRPKMSWALESSQQPFVGLLGQVARPGVYEIERKGTLLIDLLQNVGGLAKNASGQFRIIRNGRPGQMTSYSGAAKFELMPGDLVVADGQFAQPAMYGTEPKKTSNDSVQVGFVNLIDRPVVLKLRRENATVLEILSIMRQDQSLASQIKVITPPSQRGNSQPRPDAALASEVVLIFPPNSVKTDRLATLPDPFKLKRDAEPLAQPSDAVQPQSPRGNISPDVISPDVTQSSRSRPAVGSWLDSTPLPQAAQPVSQPSVPESEEFAEAPPPPADETAAAKRTSGVRGTSRRAAPIQDRVTRDTDMVQAPPAEGSTPEPSDVPTTDVVQDTAPAPKRMNSLLADDDDQTAKPSLLNTPSKKRHIQQSKDHAESDSVLTAADLEEADAVAKKVGSSWSIWPPILAAGVGLIALIGFSLSLRRRTQAAVQNLPVAMSPPQPMPPVIRHPQPAQSAQRRELLDAIIDNQLPLIEEHVPLASPMQFHGRPQPPKTIRLDQRHPLPKPHSPNESDVRSQRPEVRGQADEIEPSTTLSGSRTAATATQKFRIDRSGATENGTTIPSANSARASSHRPVSGTLDRALSAVQKQALQNRKERDA